MNREELTNSLRDLTRDFDQASNIKFYKIFWTRLQEVDVGDKPISADDATKIASVIEYDFSNVPEDNDSLSEFATEYAEYAGKVYRQIKLNGIRDITPLLRFFNVSKLGIEKL